MKKYLALLLALVMMLSMLAGCKPSGEDTKPSADTKPTTGTTEPKPTETTADTTPAEPQVLTIGMPKQATVENYDTQWMTKYIEENLNIDLQFVYFSSDTNELMTQFGLMVSGNEKLPDIMWGTSIPFASLNEYGADGYIVPLNDYLTPEKAPQLHETLTYAFDGVADKLMSYGISPIDGNQYAWPKLNEATINAAHYFTYINTDWLKDLNLEMPTTVDELYTVLKAFKEKDPNGNSKADEIAATGSMASFRASLPLFIMNAFVYTVEDYFWNATDGKVWAPYDTEEYRQGLIYLKKLVDEGLLDPGAFTIKTAKEMIPYWTPAENGDYIVGVISSYHTTSVDKTREDLFDNYDHLPWLKDATGSGRGGFAPAFGHTYKYDTFVTKDCENVELAVKFLDFMSNLEMTVTQQTGELGVDWEWSNEGQNAYGLPVMRRNISNASLWGAQNDKLWNVLGASIWTQQGTAKGFENDGSYSSKSTMLSGRIFDTFQAAPKPAETVMTLLYNEEEQELVSEVEKVLKDYVNNSRALFATGAMDPTDDADWQEYLNGLKAQGMYEWQEAAQAAYDRMNGK